VESELARHITLRQVDLVPVDYLPPEMDEDAILTKPGLAPDLLAQMWNSKVMTAAGQWRSVWISIEVPNDKQGKFPVRIIFSTGGSGKSRRKILAQPVFHLEILPMELPPQRLLVTHWFHSDCLTDYYRTEVFSEEYWRIVANFIRDAAQHGMNTLFTPVFTPPLDTQVGGERPTVQLVKVYYTKGKYHFDFSLLDRWIKVAHENGIEYFEISHLFTQWGAGFTPKIMAVTNGREKRIFGWDVPSSSPEYRKFLAAFLPEICQFLKQRKLQEKCFFHCSDEPRAEHLKSYSEASRLMRSSLSGFKMIDALSRIELFQTGCVDIPVVCERAYEPFRNLNLPERWIYYCCEPFSRYPNRFIHMPSARNRIFGALMYRYHIDGFLHWGFNFYYSRFSRFPVNPYADTTAGHAFPAGDAFLVYPGVNGMPEDSIRHEVFREALQDMRILQLLEQAYSREKLEKILDRFSVKGELSLLDYPAGELPVLKLRKRIISMVHALIQK